MSERFMMTGVPPRNASPMTRASLYERGCTVVIRRSSAAVMLVCGTSRGPSARCSGVTWAW